MPSPTIATISPRAEAATTSALSVREDAGDHAVDAGLGPDRSAVRSLSPVSSTTSAHRSQVAIARAEVGLIGRPGRWRQRLRRRSRAPGRPSPPPRDRGAELGASSCAGRPPDDDGVALDAASTPCPVRPVNCSTGSSPPPSARANAAIARANGARSRPRPRRRGARAPRGRTPSPATTPTTAGLPSVTVPVLSSTIVVTRCVRSRTSGPRIRIPSCAPRPVATITAVGVARPRRTGRR